MTAPGLTCATCHGDLYPHEAKRTDDGWRHHRARNLCNSIRRLREAEANRRARAEDLEWMAETGETFTGAAKRLGISNSALERWLRIHPMPGVYRALLARDPGAINGKKRAA